MVLVCILGISFPLMSLLETTSKALFIIDRPKNEVIFSLKTVHRSLISLDRILLAVVSSLLSRSLSS